MKSAKPKFPSDKIRSGELLSELIHRVSHEIGNPLTAIISLASVMQRFETGEKASEYAGSIAREAWKITSFNDRLVALLSSRVVENPKCDLEPALEQALERSKIQGVDYKPPLEPIAAAIDAPLFQVLVRELLSNALTYTSAESAISIQLLKDGECALLEIKNPCSPERPFSLEAAFEPFISSSSESKHLGIGLTVCWSIVDRFGGEIEIAEDDSGIFFTRVRLPLCENYRAREEFSTLPLKALLLLVEDEEGVATAIEKILQATIGKECSFSCLRLSGSDAMEYIATGEECSAILCDLNLGTISGRHVYETVLHHQPDMAQRFGFITGETLRKDVQMYLASCGRPYLHKPFEAETLANFVKGLLVE